MAIAIANSSCKRRNIVAHNGTKDLISFKSIQGITYTEVARRMKNGLAFNEYGYQLEPQWKMSFISDDSTRIYSPIKRQFINFPLTRGYDSIFNTARSWFKVRKMNKDSLLLEMLQYKDGMIDVTGSKVYMLFYTEDYINNTLHSNTIRLRRPCNRDTVFIRQMANIANGNYLKAFAASVPAQLISKSQHVIITKNKTEPLMENNFDTSDDYLNPTFYIVISKAYRNFHYSFSVYVDDKGNLFYRIPLVGFFENNYKEAYIKESKAIMNTYFKYYLNITPGSTLGMRHSSIISIHVRGIKVKSASS
ncbi:hypothetical protein [Mucilaginibacter polytrichastri]|uniref:Uncharacterized protein n=1 Tax=Mucilaginibacter polytrichastri TaxID=1302689 RepID=A0A1Q5ZXH1_9SPHI|nr:hypothetical protein [Mucilaginibacter polytrichastri]OKS86474.1 hypothetical protein RG47T_1930 [Mucilaginibacter polytrichastri]SFS78621.1 hypothetical protein SAMN04487890_10450 [Mucilaginibacter polytrichastri]